MKVTINDWTRSQLEKRGCEYKHDSSYEWNQEQLNKAVETIFGLGLNVMLAHDGQWLSQGDVSLQVDTKRFIVR